MNSVVLIFAGFVVLAVFYFVYRNSKTIKGKDRRIYELEAENSILKKEKELFIEKISWTEKSQQQLKDVFNSLAVQALRGNAEDFLKSAKEFLESILHQVRGDWSTHKTEIQKIVEPLSETLKKMDDEIRMIEQKRQGAYEGLQKEMKHLFEAQDQLRTITIQLNQALRTTEIRGQWGQLQLKRVVELAGLTKHVSYQEQVSLEEGRPDMIVHLPNGGILPIDAKTPMLAYLDAMNTAEASQRQEKLQIFAKKVKETIQILSSKKYWAQFKNTPAPEAVIMFIPNEASISAAYEIDPALIEYAAENHVLIASPVTLLGLLKAVAFGWQQYSITENARKIAVMGRQLYDRISVFVEHLKETGKSLDSAVKNYNAAISSFESRLMPSIKRLKESGISDKDIEPINHVETSILLPDVEEDKT